MTARDEERFSVPGEDGGFYSGFEVCRSAAGFYIGRMHWSPDLDGFIEPGSRESGYFATRTAAEEALAKGFKVRDCIENNAAYASGRLPRPKE